MTNSYSKWPGDFQRNPRIYRYDYLHLKELSEQIKRSIKEDIKNKKVRILDVGCGNKPYYPFFRNVAKKYIGLDTQSGEKVDIIASAERIPLRKNEFDVVLCFQVLEHLKEPKKAISEIYRVLKKEGILILSTHGIFHMHGVPYDYYRWTKYGLEKDLNKFKNVEILDNGRPGLTLFQIINVYMQRLNIFSLLTPLIVINNIFGRLIDKLLPESVTKDLFVINYYAIAKK